MKQQPDRVRNCNGSNNKLSVLLPKLSGLLPIFAKPTTAKALFYKLLRSAKGSRHRENLTPCGRKKNKIHYLHFLCSKNNMCKKCDKCEL